jgi:predicted phage terminase large subunit-like protein
MSQAVALDETAGWPLADKLRLYSQLRIEFWHRQRRIEQVEPEGDWRIWYLMGGRGSGKSRTGAETVHAWIATSTPGEWAIVAPTFGDCRDVCVESADSGILSILGPNVATYNRSLGEIHLHDGNKIFLDGADDGALRIQGRNLKGAWCDEVGLWIKWDQAWNESLAFAVRHKPGRIVATGTPKMGHGLVRQLVEDPNVPVANMSTADNLPNLHPAAVAELYKQYGGTLLGEQELEGKWIAEIEGDLLKRAWWQFFDPELLKTPERLPKFQMIVLSIDTPLKDKETSDFVALQAWGVKGGDRYLLDTRVERLSYQKCKRAVLEMAGYMRKTWPIAQHRILIENAGYGVELLLDLKREITGVMKADPARDGNKEMRAIAASADLESGNCFLPGFKMPDGSGPDERRCPASTVEFVRECSFFPNVDHDDQVDAWSQAMNWLRARGPAPLRTSSMLREGVRRPTVRLPWPRRAEGRT